MKRQASVATLRYSGANVCIHALRAAAALLLLMWTRSAGRQRMNMYDSEKEKGKKKPPFCAQRRIVWSSSWEIFPVPLMPSTAPPLWVRGTGDRQNWAENGPDRDTQVRCSTQIYKDSWVATKEVALALHVFLAGFTLLLFKAVHQADAPLNLIPKKSSPVEMKLTHV